MHETQKLLGKLKKGDLEKNIDRIRRHERHGENITARMKKAKELGLKKILVPDAVEKSKRSRVRETGFSYIIKEDHFSPEVDQPNLSNSEGLWMPTFDSIRSCCFLI